VAGDKKGARRFEDVTARAGLEKMADVCLGTAFVDIDLDGQLDLLVTRFAPDPAQALAVLRDGKAAAGGLSLLVNTAVPRRKRGDLYPEPLDPSFGRLEILPKVLGPSWGVVLADLDGDRDTDALVLGTRFPSFLMNDRLHQFHDTSFPQEIRVQGYTGGLTLSLRHGGRSDLVLTGPGRAPLLLLNNTASPPDFPAMERGAVLASPPLLQAQAIDLKADGWTDVVGLSESGKPALLHNDGKGRLVHIPEALGQDSTWPNGLVAVAVGEFLGKHPDLLVWSQESGLHLYSGQDNGNYALRLTLHGQRRLAAGTTRCNSDGIGTRVIAQAESHRTALEYTTLSAGLGQSLQPVFLGLGLYGRADVLRLRWPDEVWQAEFNLSAGSPHRIVEENRKIDW
jgi:hypothetical protein